jgi:hypothetical protein
VSAAIEQVLAVEPWLVGVKPALEVVPGMRPGLILHAAPPATWDTVSAVLREGLLGAAEFEGLDPATAELGAAQDHAAMAGGAGSITASTPVVVVEDRASGRRAFHFLMEGFGRTLILGMRGEDVYERLRWLRDERRAGAGRRAPGARRHRLRLDHGRGAPPRRRAAQPQRGGDVDAGRAARDGVRARGVWPPTCRNVCSSSCAGIRGSSSPSRWRPAA